jgi:DEAD/DEAH box helicase domain-containing protein
VIPHLVATEIRKTLLDYLRSTWQLADRDLEKALLAFLTGDRGMFKGPWLRLGLPFTQAPPTSPIPLDVKPPYLPYLHQLQAWQRLSSRDGHEPEATIVTTGTGSGKTECFLYPILDHALRSLNRREKGIQAIVLYPMNALAADQARRMASIVHADDRLRGRLRIGMFVGGKGKHKEMGASHCIDDNDSLRRNPPDILLTNYKMLDLMLQRPKDAAIWANNPPGRLRYLVLDELHSYDGAQGTDVACLVRRLGARLGKADAICPVGTSATVTGAGDTSGELLKFAKNVFDIEFAPDSLIGESRLTANELFDTFGGEAAADSTAPLPAETANLLPAPQQEAEAHVRAASALWFPTNRALAAATGDEFRGRLGEAVMHHPLTRALIRVAATRLLPWETLCHDVRAAVPALAARTEHDANALIASLLTLLSWSKRQVGTKRMPLVSVQVQLWVREVRKLLRDVTSAGEAARFRWHDDGPTATGPMALPMAYCRECGHTGWVTVASGFGDRVSTDYAEIARGVQERSPDVKYLHHDGSVRADDGTTPDRAVLDLTTGELLEVKDLRAGRVALFAQKDEEGAKGRGQQRCPACGARDAMRFLASRSASLTSVAVGHLFTTPLNTDRKLLAFSDSVQDASHRAGFFAGRTYRFALRSALLAVVPEEGTIPLAAVGPAMEAYWPARVAEGRWDPDAAFVAAFLPQDLEFLQANVQWEQALGDHEVRVREAESRGETVADAMPRPSASLVADVAQRLRWEATRELGVASRIGRTLEQSGCLAVTVDPERFARAVSRAASLLPQKIGALQGVGSAAFAQLFAGLITRLRLRGGVLDPFLKDYVENSGSDFFLSKQRAPLLSPFGRFTTKPTFLTNEAKPRHFDSVQPAERRTWLMDWLVRSLGVELDANEARDLGGLLPQILVDAGILGELPMGSKYKAWGLLPAALWVSRAHAWRRCAACGNGLSAVLGSVTDPLGAPCLRHRCEGRYEAVSDDDGRTATYYKRYYARGALGRVFPREHTGLLGRTERENLEIEFKERPRPNAANLLSCTPTLEMGIDIGDLSATLLCSVPPSPASYVQRVGRAGRETGNALLVSFAATRPHDLYYFEDPLAVMAGAIHPPGCFLDAPEVLKRQALAFCFDRLAREGHKMPGQMREALGDVAPLFPKRVLDAIAERRESLKTGFLELFAAQLKLESRKRIEAFFEPDSDGVAPVERRLADEIGAARAQREELASRVKRLSARIEKVQTDEAERKKLEDPDRELSDLRFEKSYAWAELGGLLDQDFWGFLCDRSALPNYAFPEPGVKLDAYVQREGAGAEVQRLSWVRPPASAIAELAPFNTFYGSARHVVVQNLDLKHGGAPGQWQLCAECHHMVEVVKLPDPQPACCPSCGAEGWGEVGRRRWLAPMTHVRAFARHRDATVGDESEDRERAFYESHNFYDPSASAPIHAWMNAERGFGFELLPRLTLRRVNFGQRDAKVGNAQLAGREVPEVAFVVCADCGQVQRPPDREPDPGWPDHWTTCPKRRSPRDKQTIREMHLVRKLESEALRLVVPISQHEWDKRLPNLRGALRLGLRRYFGGDPDFLLVDSYDEPLPGHEGRRRYLVVLDLVPGGTGMLVDLAHSKGAKLRQVLTLAKEALETCPCNLRGDEAKACHLCLYAYREQEALPLLDRDVALDELNAILAGFEGLLLGDTVGSLKQEQVLESELELRFVGRIEAWAREQQGAKGDTAAASFERLDKRSWRLVVGGRAWKMEAQKPVDDDEAEYQCRPDFVLSPEGQEPGVAKVAVFTDGAAYHVQSSAARARIQDDLKKRLGLSRPGKYLTWSITWRDVNEHETNTITDGIPPWWPDTAFRSQVGKLAGALKVDGLLAVLDRDPVTGLLAHLKDPRGLSKLAALAAFVLLHQRGKQLPAGQAAAQHDDAREAEVPSTSPAEPVPGGEELLAKAIFGADGEGLLVVSAPREAFAALTKRPECATVTLRLDDRQERRQTPGFQTVWRQALRAWNLLQALPNAVIASSEQLADLGSAAATTATAGAKMASVAPPQKNASVAPPSALSADAEEVLAEIRDARAREAVRAVLLRGVTVPAVPYETMVELRGNAGDIEVGWAKERVGAYLDEQGNAADRLRALGWTLFPIEAGLTEAVLFQALRTEEA